MNKPIVRLFGVVVLLFTLLIVWTTRWTVLQAKSLNDNPLNHRTLIASERIKLGRIVADDGTVLAKSVHAPGNTWTRRYPTGPKFAQAVGYAYVSSGRFAEVFIQERLVDGEGRGDSFGGGDDRQLHVAADVSRNVNPRL